MTKRGPLQCLKTSTEVIRLAVMLYVRFPPSLRNVEDLLHEGVIEVSHEMVRFWWMCFARGSRARSGGVASAGCAPRAGVGT